MPMELYHYGIKGQKWGVRRYQFADGSYTPAGKKRYQNTQSQSNVKHTTSLINMKVNELTRTMATQVTGKQYVDTCLKKGTTFSRIQTSKDFENFAFYATYKKHDVDEYLGLFGKNLMSRADTEARRAEKQANISGNETDLATARQLRNKSDGMKVYQLKIDATKKLKVPSDENA